MLIIKRITTFITAIMTLLAGFMGSDKSFTEKQPEFKVTSYFVASTVQEPENLHPEDFDIITDVILFGCATFDNKGEIHIMEKELTTAVENIRNAIGDRDVHLTLNLLGPQGYTDSPVWEDQMDVQTEEHNKAFTSGVFEDNIIEVLDKYGFDGIHFDYEYPISLKAWRYYNKFLVSLDKKLGDYTLGVASNEWNQKFSNAALEAVDTIEMMMYDIYDDEGRHSTYETATKLIREVSLRGVPLEKVNFGLPFYARPSDRDTYWYGYEGCADRIDENGWYHCDNTDKDFWFNTPDVIEAKTEFAINGGYGGVMIWHYSCDFSSSNEKSLLAGVDRAVERNYG